MSQMAREFWNGVRFVIALAAWGLVGAIALALMMLPTGQRRH
jgi:hypothetical protein